VGRPMRREDLGRIGRVPGAESVSGMLILLLLSGSRRFLPRSLRGAVADDGSRSGGTATGRRAAVSTCTTSAAEQRPSPSKTDGGA
jgi:hypothetical protein